MNGRSEIVPKLAELALEQIPEQRKLKRKMVAYVKVKVHLASLVIYRTAQVTYTFCYHYFYYLKTILNNLYGFHFDCIFQTLQKLIQKQPKSINQLQSGRLLLTIVRVTT